MLKCTDYQTFQADSHRSLQNGETNCRLFSRGIIVSAHWAFSIQQNVINYLKIGFNGNCKKKFFFNLHWFSFLLEIKTKSKKRCEKKSLLFWLKLHVVVLQSGRIPKLIFAIQSTPAYANIGIFIKSPPTRKGHDIITIVSPPLQLLVSVNLLVLLFMPLD